MLRAVLISAWLLAVPVTTAAPAAAADAAEDPKRCEDNAAKKKKKKSMFGGMVGGIAGNVLSRAGVPGSIGGVVPTNDLLSEVITALLDCNEQKQAADATNEAVRGGVGSTASWTSETRPNVSGSSSVTGAEQSADGSHCMTVTDVVIIDGEETTAPKRMCRAPGASGYKRA